MIYDPFLFESSHVIFINKGIFGCCNGADISVDLKGFDGEIFLKERQKRFVKFLKIEFRKDFLFFVKKRNSKTKT